MPHFSTGICSLDSYIKKSCCELGASSWVWDKQAAVFNCFVLSYLLRAHLALLDPSNQELDFLQWSKLHIKITV